MRCQGLRFGTPQANCLCLGNGAAFGNVGLIVDSMGSLLWLVVAALCTAAGMRWRWVRVVGAIAIAALSLSMLWVAPTVLSWAMFDNTSTVCRPCLSEIRSLAHEGVRGLQIDCALVISILGIWAIVGDRWARRKAG